MSLERNWRCKWDLFSAISIIIIYSDKKNVIPEIECMPYHLNRKESMKMSLHSV